MGYGIWRADREGAVEDPGQEGDPIVPTHRIILAEVTPHGRVGSMHLRHRCDHDDGHDATANNKNQSDLVQEWQYPVPENDQRAAGPCYDDESDIDVPRLDDQVGMEYGIHLYRHVRGDGHDRGKIEYPAEEIERAGEESKDAAITGAGSYRGPVVDTTGGGNRGGELWKVGISASVGGKMVDGGTSAIDAAIKA